MSWATTTGKHAREKNVTSAGKYVTCTERVKNIEPLIKVNFANDLKQIPVLSVHLFVG